MKTMLEKFVVKFLLSRSGPVLQKIVSGTAAAAVTYGAAHVPGLEELLPAETMAGLLWLLLDIALTRFGGKILGDHAKTLQRIANKYGSTPMAVDGYVGPVTTAVIANELHAAKK